MSLISIQNFASPLTNKTHLIAIVLAAVLFAAFRLSGGKIEGRGLAAPASGAAVQQDAVDTMLDEQEDVEEDADITPQRDLVDEMIGRERNNASKEHQSDSGLADIERKLGLR